MGNSPNFLKGFKGIQFSWAVLSKNKQKTMHMIRCQFRWRDLISDLEPTYLFQELVLSCPSGLLQIFKLRFFSSLNWKWCHMECEFLSSAPGPLPALRTLHCGPDGGYQPLHVGCSSWLWMLVTHSCLPFPCFQLLTIICFWDENVWYSPLFWAARCLMFLSASH